MLSNAEPFGNAHRGEQFIDASVLPAPDKFGQVAGIVDIESDAVEFDHPAIGFGRRGLRQMFGQTAGAEM
jgi:hypothetical protein